MSFKSAQQWRGTIHVEVPILQLVTKATLGDLSEPQCCHLENGNSVYCVELWKFSKINYVNAPGPVLDLNCDGGQGAVC